MLRSYTVLYTKCLCVASALQPKNKTDITVHSKPSASSVVNAFSLFKHVNWLCAVFHRKENSTMATMWKILVLFNVFIAVLGLDFLDTWVYLIVEQTPSNKTCVIWLCDIRCDISFGQRRRLCVIKDPIGWWGTRISAVYDRQFCGFSVMPWLWDEIHVQHESSQPVDWHGWPSTKRGLSIFRARQCECPVFGFTQLLGRRRMS